MSVSMHGQVVVVVGDGRGGFVDNRGLFVNLGGGDVWWRWATSSGGQEYGSG